MTELYQHDAGDDCDQSEGEPQIDVLISAEESDDGSGQRRACECERQGNAEILRKTQRRIETPHAETAGDDPAADDDHHPGLEVGRICDRLPGGYGQQSEDDEGDRGAEGNAGDRRDSHGAKTGLFKIAAETPGDTGQNGEENVRFHEVTRRNRITSNVMNNLENREGEEGKAGSTRGPNGLEKRSANYPFKGDAS